MVSHSKEITEKPYLIANIGTLNLLFWTRMSLWKIKSVKVVLVIIRVLGTIPKRMKEYLRNINSGIELAALQSAFLNPES